MDCCTATACHATAHCYYYLFWFFLSPYRHTCIAFACCTRRLPKHCRSRTRNFGSATTLHRWFYLPARSHSLPVLPVTSLRSLAGVGRTNVLRRYSCSACISPFSWFCRHRTAAAPACSPATVRFTCHAWFACHNLLDFTFSPASFTAHARVAHTITTFTVFHRLTCHRLHHYHTPRFCLLLCSGWFLLLPPCRFSVTFCTPACFGFTTFLLRFLGLPAPFHAPAAALFICAPASTYDICVHAFCTFLLLGSFPAPRLPAVTTHLQGALPYLHYYTWVPLHSATWFCSSSALHAPACYVPATQFYLLWFLPALCTTVLEQRRTLLLFSIPSPAWWVFSFYLLPACTQFTCTCTHCSSHLHSYSYFYSGWGFLFCTLLCYVLVYF